jgi:hypothetical protein
MEAAQFEFERFVCRDDQRPERKPKPREEKSRRPRTRPDGADEAAGQRTDFQVKKGEKPPQPEELSPLDLLPALAPTALQKRQHELEARFLQIDGPLDMPERQALWPELALTYTALGNLGDAAVCWANVLWEEGAAAAHQMRLWHEANLGEQRGRPAAQVLDALLATKDPSSDEVRLLTSFVLDAAYRDQPEPALLERLHRAQHFMQAHEQRLPARAVWLVGLALHRLSGGDVLVLARTRDRLLGRLFATGLTADSDLPGFLRFSGASGHARFQVFRDWLARLPERVHHWLTKVNPVGTAPAPGETVAYADLILAFGFARLGEKELAQVLHQRAKKRLASKDDVHACLQHAFSHRIDQALAGVPALGPLPADCLDYLDKLKDDNERFKVNRLRQYSNILEPHEEVNAYRYFTLERGSEMDRAVAALADHYDPARLEAALAELLRRYGNKGKEAKANRARILLEVVDLTPRVGQDLSLALLAEVAEARRHLPDLMDQAALLEKGLLVAAHFDQLAFVTQFTAQIQQLLQTREFRQLLRTQPMHKPRPVLDELLGQCFRSLRKMGLRDVIAQLLQQLSDAVLEGKPIEAYRAEGKNLSSILRALLQVASCRFYFGMDSEARPILDETRQLLFAGELDRHDLRNLANAYINTLGQAPAELALRAIDELLQKLQGVHVVFSTDSHYGLVELKLVETLVAAIVTDDFAQGGQARRWLDDDEYLIRRRIHHDVQRALGQG